MSEPESPLDPAVLRARAEAAIAEQASDSAEAANLRELHELHVHEIELRMQNEQLLLAHEALNAALKELRIAAVTFESQEGVMILDAEGRILRVNRAFTRLTGYTPEDVLQRNPAVLSGGQNPAFHYEHMWAAVHERGYWQGEMRYRCKNGDLQVVWMTMSVVKDSTGRALHHVGTFTDITRNKQAEAEIHHLAYYDQLTQLPNRRMFIERHALAMGEARRTRCCCSLLFVDLDNFKTLNDTRGHGVGDLLLVETARRIRAILRQEDLVARLGGDEFVVMLEGLDVDPDEAARQTRRVGEDIRASLVQPFELAGVHYECSASLGATVFAGGPESPESQLKQADQAMYKAKQSGRNALRFFDPAMQSAIDARGLLEGELRHAVDRQELRLFLQPECDAEGQVCGAELLLRWQHQSRGLLAPEAFLPLAEEIGLIVTLDHWTLTGACAILARWAGDPRTAQLHLSLNISALALQQAGFVAMVEASLASSGADPRRLRIELTEGSLIEDVPGTLPKLEALRVLGIRFALDDFGTGYSSLAYLTRLPLDCLKIDRLFIRRMLDHPNDAVVTRAIINLALSLGLSVVAEGVETEAQRSFLLAHGCRAYQGFLFSPPLPAQEFEVFLRAP